MIDLFTYLYPNVPISKNNFLNKIRFYSMARFITRQISNVLLPLYFKVGNFLFPKKYTLNSKDKNGLIISFTSFPARIDYVWLVVESILRQSVKPDKIILWLSKEQFDNYDSLPSRLLKLRNRGLDIVLCDGDLRSHKKYYYTVKQFPNANFIIIDDDVFYPKNLIENLLKYYNSNPGCVCFNRGYEVMFDDKQIKPYSEWKTLSTETNQRQDIMPTGVGGVFYPAESLAKEVVNKEIFMEHCQYADDIWLYAMLLFNDKSLVKTKENRIFLPIINKNNVTLSSENVNNNRNDKQLLSLREYYINERGIDVFGSLIRNF